jgi:hypothetical protein
MRTESRPPAPHNLPELRFLQDYHSAAIAAGPDSTNSSNGSGVAMVSNPLTDGW